jgi:hypothetical protein
MQKQFTPCPACGALGEVNSTCQFCGTTIFHKEGIKTSDSRIVQQRTVTPQQYAEKVSIYHNIIGINSEISKVSIGNLEGIINLNGDIIYPLGNEPIRLFKNYTVQIGKKFLNLENFEYIENPYHNEAVLEKIKKLSNAIYNNPSEKGFIELGFIDKDDYYIGDCITIQNATMHSWSEFYGLSPQLTIMFAFDCLSEAKIISRYGQFKECDDFSLFEEMDSDDEGTFIEEPFRHRYLLCEHNAEQCEEIALRILHQLYKITPENATLYMNCAGGIFSPEGVNNNETKNEESGCMGSLALLLSFGGASIYWLVELIKHFII